MNSDIKTLPSIYSTKTNRGINNNIKSDNQFIKQTFKKYITCRNMAKIKNENNMNINNNSKKILNNNTLIDIKKPFTSMIKHINNISYKNKNNNILVKAPLINNNVPLISDTSNKYSKIRIDKNQIINSSKNNTFNTNAIKNIGNNYYTNTISRSNKNINSQVSNTSNLNMNFTINPKITLNTNTINTTNTTTNINPPPFDSANSNVTSDISYVYAKVIPDSIENNKFRVWFNFSVYSDDNIRKRVIIENMSNFKGLFNNGYKIVYAILPENVTPSEFQKTYNPSDDYLYKRLNIPYEIFLDEQKNELKIEFNFVFPKKRYVLFSFNYPWSYSKNLAFLNYIEKNIDKSIYFHKEILTYSKEKRSLHLLTISSRKNMEKKREFTINGLFPENHRCLASNHDKQIIFITARVHPGETPGSHMMTGILKAILRAKKVKKEIESSKNESNNDDIDDEYNDDKNMQILLDNFVFKIIPIINVDGVYNGKFRLSIDGKNLNRCYLAPDKIEDPEIYAVKKIFFYYAKNYKVRYYFDLHADIKVNGMYTFGNAIDNFLDHVENVLFSFVFKLSCPRLNFAHCIFSEKSMKTRSKNDKNSKEATSRVNFYKTTGLIHAYTIENSYFKGKFNFNNDEIDESKDKPEDNSEENNGLYDILTYHQNGYDLLMTILYYEGLVEMEEKQWEQYKDIAGAREHIARIVKFNEERFKFNYSLNDLITNIEEKRQWKSIKEIKDKYEKNIKKIKKTNNIIHKIRRKTNEDNKVNNINNSTLDSKKN